MNPERKTKNFLKRILTVWKNWLKKLLRILIIQKLLLLLKIFLKRISFQKSKLIQKMILLSLRLLRIHLLKLL